MLLQVQRIELQGSCCQQMSERARWEGIQDSHMVEWAKDRWLYMYRWGESGERVWISRSTGGGECGVSIGGV